MFSRIDHKLEHKTILDKLTRIEIISSLFSEHNRMKVEINHLKRNEKKMISWKLNIMSLKTKQLNYDVKEEIKHWREMKIKHNHTKSMGCRKNSS